MGFMSPAFTALATGALAQADENLDTTDDVAAQAFTQRQKVFDQVSQQQEALNAKVQDTANRQQGYMALYHIPSDLAYTLATNPAVTKMDPDKLADYIHSLQPTGQSAPATPGQAPVMAAPQLTRDNSLTGNLRNALSPGSAGVLCSPAMYHPAIPGTPAHQIYSTPAGMTNADQTRNGTAAHDTLEGLAKGWWGPNQVAAVYKSRGGNDANAFKDMDLNSIYKSGLKDPQISIKVNAFSGAIQSLYPDLNPQQVSRLATFAATGGFKVTTNQFTGATQVTNLLTGQPVTPQEAEAIAKGTQAANGAVNNTPTATNTPPTAGAAPQPTPSTQPNTAAVPNQPAQPQDVVMPKFQPSPDVGKQELQQTTQRFHETPKLIANVNFAMALAHKDPEAISYWGGVATHLGSPIYNVLLPFTKTGADNFADWLKIADKKEIDTALVMLETSAIKPEMSSYISSNSAGMGTGGKEFIENWLGAFEHGDIQSSLVGLGGSLDAFNTITLNNYAIDYSNLHYGIMQQMDNPAVRKGLYTDLVQNQHFDKNNANQIVSRLYNLSRGKSMQ